MLLFRMFWCAWQLFKIYNFLWFPFSLQRNTQLEPNFVFIIVYSFSWESPPPKCTSFELHQDLGSPPRFPLVCLFPPHVLCTRASATGVQTAWSRGPSGGLALLPPPAFCPAQRTVALASQRVFVHFSGQDHPVCSVLFFLPRLWHITCLIFAAFADVGPSVVFLERLYLLGHKLSVWELFVHCCVARASNSACILPWGAQWVFMAGRVTNKLALVHFAVCFLVHFLVLWIVFCMLLDGYDLCIPPSLLPLLRPCVIWRHTELSV